MKKLLLLGGTGFVGRHVCEQIERLQWRGTVPTRRLSNARPVLMLPMITPLEADVHDDAQLARLVAGHDAVVNLVGVLHGSEAAFEAAHVEFPKRLARACRQAGVRRLVHLSALGADPHGPSMYQRSKARGEAALRQHAAELYLTILRPSVMFGREDRFVNMFAQLQQRFAFLPLARGDARFQPVWVQDVARAISACLQQDQTIGQTYEACGPSIWTLRELVEFAGRLTGKNRPIYDVSERVGRWQATLLGWLPGEPVMSHDNLDSMKTDNVASGELPGVDALGIRTAELGPVVRGYLGTRNWENRLIDYRKTAGRY